MVDAHTWVRINHLVCSLLPCPTALELLERLAEGWRELTEAEAVFVSALGRSGHAGSGALARKGMPRGSWEFPDLMRPDWSIPAASAALAGVVDSEFRWQPSPHDVVLRFSENIVGGLLIFSPAHHLLETLPIGELSEWSARLIADRIDVEARLTSPQNVPLDTARLKALAEFAAGAGHEINNPVATIAGRASLLLPGETDPERRLALATIGGQALRIRDMIGDLMLFARPPQPDPEYLNLSESVESVLAHIQPDLDPTGCEIDRNLEPDVPVWADPTQLSVVISNLVHNALEALGEDGRLAIGTQTAQENEHEWAVLTVSDNGPGLSETDRVHLFDPFYSGRQAGRGLGFGLPKCWRIVTGHGGRIEVQSAPDSGVTFRVLWPAQPTDGKTAPGGELR